MLCSSVQHKGVCRQTDTRAHAHTLVRTHHNEQKQRLRDDSEILSYMVLCKQTCPMDLILNFTQTHTGPHICAQTHMLERGGIKLDAL